MGEKTAALGTIAASGAVSGFLTYLWRTPFDTLYKQSVGWRDPNAPLWSLDRFLRSPRGLKAVAVGAATWSAYELADAALRWWVEADVVEVVDEQGKSIRRQRSSRG